MLNIISREKPAVYRGIFKRILQIQIKELLKQERCKDDLHTKCREQDYEGIEKIVKIKNTNMSGDVGSDEKAENGSESCDETSHGGDDYESELYEDDEEDEYESGFKDDAEEDDDYENIEDGVSIKFRICRSRCRKPKTHKIKSHFVKLYY